MRWTAALLLLLATACGERRSFDDRYDDTAAELGNRAARIDAELNASGESEPGNEGYNR